METNDPNGILFGLEATKKRLAQMEINFKFVMNAIEIIHRNLCPGPGGTWQDRVKRAVEASEKLKNG